MLDVKFVELKKVFELELELEFENEEVLEKKKVKEVVDKEKQFGIENYKKCNFDEVIKYYQVVWDFYKDIIYFNNFGVVYFEKGDYQVCIDICIKVVEEGCVFYVDFKFIVKLYVCVGIVYEKLGDFVQVVDYYNMFFCEYWILDVVIKVWNVECNKIEVVCKVYIDLEKVEEVCVEGNMKFKELDWLGVVVVYLEMIKCVLDDFCGYSNCVVVFIKLFEFFSVFDDCDVVIKKDFKFICVYICKVQVYYGMCEYSKCVDVCIEVYIVDNEYYKGVNVKEIEQQQ